MRLAPYLLAGTLLATASGCNPHLKESPEQHCDHLFKEFAGLKDVSVDNSCQNQKGNYFRLRRIYPIMLEDGCGKQLEEIYPVIIEFRNKLRQNGCFTAEGKEVHPLLLQNH